MGSSEKERDPSVKLVTEITAGGECRHSNLPCGRFRGERDPSVKLVAEITARRGCIPETQQAALRVVYSETLIGFYVQSRGSKCGGN